MNVPHATEPRLIFISRGLWAAAVPHSPAVSPASHTVFLAAEPGETLGLNLFDLQKNMEENTISLQL